MNSPIAHIGAVLALTMISWAANADASRHELKSYADLEAEIADFDPATTLLVFDNDDTLSTMPCLSEESCQYLGGAAWFSWQESLLDQSSPYKVAGSFDDLLLVSNFIFNASNMQVSDPELPGLLERLTEQGMRLMVETARGGETVNATERQLGALISPGGKTFDLLSLVRANAPTFDDGDIPSLEGPFIPCSMNGAAPVTYRQGVMYLAGQNKGTMLKCLLRLYSADRDGQRAMPVQTIVFIDDTPRNVDKVVAAFKDEPGITVKAFHYSAFDQHKARLTMGRDAQKLQDRAKARWDQISNALHGAIEAPAVTRN